MEGDSVDKVSAIEDLYFVLEKNIVEIAATLSVSKQYVSKILNTEFKDRLEIEKQSRKEKNKEKRNKQKAQVITDKRKDLYDYHDIIDLRRQHEIDTMCMSRAGKLSTRSAVYLSINAYNVKGNNLVYNDKVGKRPNDLPQKFKLSIDIYK
jgi:transposase